MKRKIFITVLIITAIFLFQSQAPWEGAAGVASQSELPASGFFIATNSFPRNTVVDITNIENGKSTRAIVANSINNPGLLAVVSRDAADLIGMRQGSISRIRIVAPSEPIAYQRFTEGLSQETPPFDSGNVIRSEAELLAEVYGNDAFRPSNGSTQIVSPGSEFSGPSYQMEPEWGGSARLDIIDIPRFNEEPVGPFPPANGQQSAVIAEQPRVTEPPVYIEQPPVYVEQPPVYITQPDPIPYTPPPVQVVEVQDDIRKSIEPFNTEQPASDIEKQTSAFYTEAPLENIDKQAIPRVAEGPREDVIKQPSPFFTETPRDDLIKQTMPRYAETPRDDVVKQASPRIVEAPRDDVIKAVPRYISEIYDDAIAKHVQLYRPEQTAENITKNVDGFNSEVAAAETAKNVDVFYPLLSSPEVVKAIQGFTPELSSSAVVKAVEGFSTEQSPEDIVKIVHYFSPEQSHNDIIKIVQGFYPDMSSGDIIKLIEKFEKEQEQAEIAKAANEFTTIEEPVRVVSEPVPPVYTPPVYTPPVVTAPPTEQKDFNIVSTTERPPVYPHDINPNNIIPGIVTTQPVVTAPPVTPERSFSLDRINYLDRGQYYVQIASSSADTVENTIRQFDPQVFRYGPKVYMDRDNLYRIVIGPLNQGESAAVLARFKSIGYRDAFVRRGG